MLRFKHTVRFHPILAIGIAAQVANEVFGAFGYDVWITSANDGVHKPDSFHYKDSALDIRLKHVPAALRADIVQNLRDRLCPQFDVLWESKGTENEHVHIEYDPK